MKFSLYVLYCSLLLPLIITVPAKDALGQKRDELLDRELQEIAIQYSNLPLALRHLSEDYKVPIGFEVSPDDDLLIDRKIELKRDRATLKDVLTNLIPEDSLYSWEVRDEVINVFPKGRREPLLSSLLDTSIKNVSVSRATSRFGFSYAITGDARIRAVLASFGVEPNNEAYSSHDILGFGKNFSLNMSDSPLRVVLNKLIRESDAKFWFLNRDGKKGEFLLLKL
jgi:hypothetical protein